MSENTTSVTGHIGGERAHRGFFGGTQPKGRMIALAICFAAMLVITPVLGAWGVVIAAAAGVIAVMLTQRTHRGSVVDRRIRRSRWRSRQRTGTDRFVPYGSAEWALLEAAATSERGAARMAAQRELAAMRANPDGADGMGWLQHTPGEPGIAWHAPVGESPYLSVTFSVTGQTSGVESSSAMRRAAEAWGTFLAARAAESNLVDEVQTVTRVLPADSALQEFWVLAALDPDAPADAIRSYEEVLRLSGRDAMVQRHFITVRWPITPTFLDAAARHGAGRDGWRSLMVHEIAATTRGLTEARVGQVEAITARKLAAVILHQQNPSRPIDLLAGVNPTQVGVASHDEFSAHITTGTDPATSEPVQWWHRTAAIHSEDLAVGPRNQLWVLDLLIGSDVRFIRTISFHLRLVPKAAAHSAAKADLTRDRADLRADLEKGRLVGDETDANLSAAERRATDLGHGSPHHGVSWVGFITITETDRHALMRASRALEDTCNTGLGITRLDWLDSYQSAASGTTWPIARGLAPEPHPVSAQLMSRLAGRAEKEAIS